MSETKTIAIEGIDVQLGLLLNGGIMDNYMGTLAIFYKDGLEKIDQLVECLENNDINRYTTLVHGLKNAAISVGAREVSDFARTLEIAGNRDDSVIFIFENNDEFLTKLKALLNNIGVVLNDEKEIETNAEQLKFMQEMLVKLKNAFENMDAKQINALMKSIEEKKWDKTNNELIGKLSSHILLFEYDDGIALINRYLPG